MDDITFSATDINIAKQICSLHNRQLPAIKELRAKLNLGLREAKNLLDDIWSTVEHPEHVEYDYLDRVDAKPVVAHSYSLRMEAPYLYIAGRPSSGIVTIKLNKANVQKLKDFGISST